jgi:hypothetical protein
MITASEMKIESATIMSKNEGDLILWGELIS